eukprot:scaffold124491_cov36-Tisochrysis_lutea.AAC.1
MDSAWSTPHQLFPVDALAVDVKFAGAERATLLALSSRPLGLPWRRPCASAPTQEEHELAPQEDPDAHSLGDIWVDKELRYFVHRGGEYHEVKLDVMGEPHIYDKSNPQPSKDELYTPRLSGDERTTGRPKRPTKYQYHKNTRLRARDERWKT